MNSPKPPFEIGLVMAGAVSAGAYTAGVIDYLLDALDAWHYAQKNNPAIPQHQVCIRVMSGASAGGMTLAIAAIEILRRANHPEAMRQKGYQSLMYQAWVKKIDIREMLNTNDLKNNEPLRSLLDATVIDHLANEVIDSERIPPFKQLPYISPELKLYLTLSNLRGLPYEFKMKGESGLPYGMMDHSDYQYVELKADIPKSDWIKLRHAAVATGAFPVGLASRLIQRDMHEYKTRVYKDGRDVSGLMKVEDSKNHTYNFVAVDGGALNNEPIELARSTWERATDEEKARIKTYDDFKEVRRLMDIRAQAVPHALVMIDPFPNTVEPGKNATDDDTALINTIGPIIGALMNQSLFKTEELFRAADRHTNDRFLIAPVRYTNTDTLADHAIACGFFAGFGGFLAEEFREHDYLLGRRNCQRFLERYFVLPKKKAIELGWPIVESYVIEDPHEEDPELKLKYPVIPVIKGSYAGAEQGKENPWPVYRKIRSHDFKTGLNKRVPAVIEKAFPLGWLSSVWISLLIGFAGTVTIAGEYLKTVQVMCDCNAWIPGLENIYVVIFQVLMLCVFLALTGLRLAKILIFKKIKNKIFKLLLSHMRNWGISIE
ncbi:MAG TPA: patatin-like phospholipase family protein [Ohtaekwangia sp.]|nr:patatin-like phospholipase family protein [Ohtaekwangia sp.]